jgi:hypothetical protein
MKKQDKKSKPKDPKLYRSPTLTQLEKWDNDGGYRERDDNFVLVNGRLCCGAISRTYVRAKKAIDHFIQTLWHPHRQLSHVKPSKPQRKS